MPSPRFDDFVVGPELSEDLSYTTDCASSLMDMMHHLSLQQLQTDTLCTAPGFLTQCYKSICRILICPCSQRLEIVLLAAAACNTILDTFTSLIRETRTNGTDEEGNSSRLLSELRQLTRLMLQYTRRYSNEEESQMGAIVPELASELKLRLQATIDEAASLQFQVA